LLSSAINIVPRERERCGKEFGKRESELMVKNIILHEDMCGPLYYHTLREIRFRNDR